MTGKDKSEYAIQRIEGFFLPADRSVPLRVLEIDPASLRIVQTSEVMDAAGNVRMARSEMYIENGATVVDTIEEDGTRRRWGDGK